MVQELHHEVEWPLEVRELMAEYLRMMDSACPGRLDGLFLTGSLALGDYIPGLSDVDFVSLSTNPWSNSDLQAVESVHVRLGRRRDLPQLDGIYTTWNHLARSALSAPVAHAIDGTLHRESRHAANPVTWATMERHPVVIRGPQKPVIHHDQELVEWCLTNLETYWSNWVTGSRWNGRRFAGSFSREATTWGVLGVIRLHATIRTNVILSKTAAHGYALSRFPHWQTLLDVALSGRRRVEASPKLGPLKRRRQTLEFVQEVIEDARKPDSST